MKKKMTFACLAIICIFLLSSSAAFYITQSYEVACKNIDGLIKVENAELKVAKEKEKLFGKSAELSQLKYDSENKIKTLKRYKEILQKAQKSKEKFDKVSKEYKDAEHEYFIDKNDAQEVLNVLNGTFFK